MVMMVMVMVVMMTMVVMVVLSQRLPRRRRLARGRLALLTQQRRLPYEEGAI